MVVRCGDIISYDSSAAYPKQRTDRSPPSCWRAVFLSIVAPGPITPSPLAGTAAQVPPMARPRSVRLRGYARARMSHCSSRVLPSCPLLCCLAVPLKDLSSDAPWVIQGFVAVTKMHRGLSAGRPAHDFPLQWAHPPALLSSEYNTDSFCFCITVHVTVTY